MPAGDLLTDDYQVELRGLLMGVGTIYQIGEEGIDGLGNPKAKTADADLDGQHGAFGSPDYMDVRVILIPLTILEDSAADAFNALKLLSIAWEPVVEDVQLHLQLPGWGHIYFLGRPRSLDADTRYVKAGEVACIAEFHALDPEAIEVGS